MSHTIQFFNKRDKRNNQLRNIASSYRSILTFITRVAARTLRSKAPLRACGFGQIIPWDESKMQSVPPFLRYAIEPYSAELLNEMIGTIILVTLHVS